MPGRIGLGRRETHRLTGGGSGSQNQTGADSSDAVLKLFGWHAALLSAQLPGGLASAWHAQVRLRNRIYDLHFQAAVVYASAASQRKRICRKASRSVRFFVGRRTGTVHSSERPREARSAPSRAQSD